MPRPTKRTKPRKDTAKQVRRACLRLWADTTTPAKMAERLEVRLEWIYLILDPVKEAVMRMYQPGMTADAIAVETGIPIAYVNYVIRRINAVRKPGGGG